MIAPLAVLGLVVDRAAVDLDFADRVRALVVGHVVERFEEAELLAGKELRRFALCRLVAHRHLPDFEVLAGRHEEQRLDFEPLALADDARVAQPVPALVGDVRGLDRFPARIPHCTAVIHINVAPAQIVGHVVVAIARQTAQLGVLPEGVAAGGVGAQTEEFVLPEVVQPGQRRIGPRHDVFPPRVVEIAVGIRSRCRHFLSQSFVQESTQNQRKTRAPARKAYIYLKTFSVGKKFFTGRNLPQPNNQTVTDVENR